MYVSSHSAITQLMLKIWAKLYKGRIMLSIRYIAILWITDSKTDSIILLIGFYPVDRVIQPLNNWGLQEARAEILDFSRGKRKGQRMKSVYSYSLLLQMLDEKS